MTQLPPALEAMKAFPQFMIYKLVPRQGTPGKMDKLPCSLDGKPVSAHASEHWVDADTACFTASAMGEGWGVAYVLTDADPFFFIDIDNCLVNGAWSTLATDLCQRFPGAAVEISSSGTGLHIIGSIGDVPDHGCKNIPLGLECYTELRFIALTGTGAVGNAATRHDDAFNSTVAQYFPAAAPVSSCEWSAGPCEGAYPITDDEALIAKALQSTSVAAAFGGKASFRDLWEANVEVLSDAYPDDHRPYDASSADAALAQHLAFWTGNDCERIERLMRCSGLVRTKWDKHRSYMRRTVTGACGRQTTWYSVGKPIELQPCPTVSVTHEIKLRDGYQMIGPSQLIEHFKNCVYVADANRILTPGGVMLKQEQFNVMYGGYVFALDAIPDKTTKSAWEAFTVSQAVVFPKVQKMDYRPDRPFSDVWVEDGITYTNGYRPCEDVGEPGDVSWFTTHIRKLYPADADMLLDWMAVKVQNPGKCMLWAPVLIGTYGNGKTTISDIMAGVMGYHTSTIVQSSDVENKFNGWVFGNTFAAINDFKVGDKKDVIEILKPLITDRRIPYQKKGLDQETCTNMLGIMITSNHMDAIVKTKDDRRYAPFVSKHTCRSELEADGMNSDYFYNLDQHARNREHIRHVRHFLMTRQVVNFPNRSPETSTTQQVIAASLGNIEQEIMEAIEEGRTGFAGGWVSSLALDKLLVSMRAERQIPRSRRRALMMELGYDWHPALKDGRVNNIIITEGGSGKPRLYIKRGHIHSNLTRAVDVAQYYQAAQGDPVAAAQIASNGK
ncbi:MAG: DUF5906 domain-containing protein [Edwardsiella phage MSW-3]|uniref:DNA primase n=1 Tax=Edwardsiella phage MSW-3 TaxID=1264700 RepID=L0MZ44_9CAUD|nr:DNA primase [Edwardsiella phage MSW-3]BAM68880.1 hypothetical protein [Edwardsiella phage MSW-3]BEU28786.1 MAG: DUF5906 domain-containing protein [Edwardsiella phage MSW-3]